MKKERLYIYFFKVNKNIMFEINWVNWAYLVKWRQKGKLLGETFLLEFPKFVSHHYDLQRSIILEMSTDKSFFSLGRLFRFMIMVLCISIFNRHSHFFHVPCVLCCFCRSISEIENETTWGRRMLDMAYQCAKVKAASTDNRL